jgi:hypothetical protein
MLLFLNGSIGLKDYLPPKFFFKLLSLGTWFMSNIHFGVVIEEFSHFLPLLDTTEEVFICCGIQQKRFSSVVGYNREGFPLLWENRRGFPSLVDITRNNLRMF